MFTLCNQAFDQAHKLALEIGNFASSTKRQVSQVLRRSSALLLSPPTNCIQEEKKLERAVTDLEKELNAQKAKRDTHQDFRKQEV